MRLTFIGAGAAFTLTPGEYQSNMLLEHNGQRLLIDCGTDARHALNALGYSYKDITDVYISHLHADHCGGLEWLAIRHFFDKETPKPKLYAADKTLKMLWKHSLQAGLKTLEHEQCSLSTFFDEVALAENTEFTWHGLKINLVKTIHTYHNGWLNPSYGLFIEYQHHRIFLTTDTQFTRTQLDPYYEKSTVIFHDCETLDKPSGVHATFNDLTTLPSEFKKKTWLYHYNEIDQLNAEKHGFLGFIKTGQSFNFEETNLKDNSDD